MSAKNPSNCSPENPGKITKVYCKLPGVSGRNDTMEIKKSQAEKCINSMNAEFVVYSNESASAGTKSGGTGVAITRGVARN